MNSKNEIYHGNASCPGSFGELLQGILPGNKRFLVNFKISNKSTAKISLGLSEYSKKKEDQFLDSYKKKSKANKIIRNLLSDQGLHHDCHLEIESDIPVGKGLSSSTADMTAACYAVKNALNLDYSQEYISKMLTEIEPSDGLHLSGTSAYHHNTGEHIFSVDYIPAFTILGVDFGGQVDTVSLNQEKIQISEAQEKEYESMLLEMQNALKNKDDTLIASLATKSTIIWQNIFPKPQFEEVLNLKKKIGALGVINTHSGSYIGFIFPHSEKSFENEIAQIKKNLTEIKIYKYHYFNKGI